MSRAGDLRRAAVDPHDPRPAHRDPGGDPRMSTDSAGGRRRHGHDDLADRLAGRQQERAGPPLRRMGGERADDRVRRRPPRRWPRTSSATRAPPIRCWPSSASSARTRACDTAIRSRCIAARAARLGVGDRRQPRRRRHPHHVRGQRPRQLDRAPGAARAQDPAGGGRAPASTPRRGSSGSAAPAAPTAELLRAAHREMWAQAARWPGPADHPGYRRRGGAAEWSATGPRPIRERVRDWLSELSGRARARGDARRPDRLVGLGRAHRR